MPDHERKIRLGENEFYLSDFNTIFVTPVGIQNKKKGIENKNAILQLANMVEGKVNIVADLNRIGKPSLEARRGGMEIFNSDKVDKVAFFGLHPVAKVIASFLIGVSRTNSIRFFKTKKEALDWIGYE